MKVLVLRHKTKLISDASLMLVYFISYCVPGWQCQRQNSLSYKRTYLCRCTSTIREWALSTVNYTVHCQVHLTSATLRTWFYSTFTWLLVIILTEFLSYFFCTIILVVAAVIELILPDDWLIHLLLSHYRMIQKLRAVSNISSTRKTYANFC
jgi:hypothetical protein